MSYHGFKPAVQRPETDHLTSRQSSSTTPHTTPVTQLPSLLDFDFVQTRIRSLNLKYPPVLTEHQLRNTIQHAQRKLAHLLGRPFDEVWAEACTTWTEILVRAKGEEGGNTVNTPGGRDEKKRSLTSPPAVPAHTSNTTTASMATPTLGQFLNQVNGFIKARNEVHLADWLVLEPPFGTIYAQLIEELRRVYPKHKESALEEKCAQSLKAAQEGDQGSNWTSFTRFMVQYLGYLRDVSPDPSAYLETYNLLRELQGRGNSALGHPSLGNMMLQTVVTNARLVCRLAIGLDRQPELLVGSRMEGAGEEGGYRETLPEKAANTIRVAFTTALNDRSGSPGGLDSQGKPEGKKRGIYILVNLCLKILFQCRKTRNATQIFEQISGNAPPLAAYPKSQRVTYLYYLGRFLFQHSHFYRAQLALEAAYSESPAHDNCSKQRRLILVYLITCNIILGRFPSQALLSRPEAHGLAERFQPLCAAIRSGDLRSFHHLTSLSSPHAAWFLHYRILFQLQNRCEVLAWRSLVRKTFVLQGVTPEAGTNKAASLNLQSLVAAFTSLTPALLASSNEQDEYLPDPDFDGADLGPPRNNPLTPSDAALESILSSLIDQGFVKAYIAHKQKKLAILGAKASGGNAVAAGFPNIWSVVCKNDKDGGTVPGWKRAAVEEQRAGVGVFG
ncbi:hypothetical protein Q7P36_003899 [Cladosporium allicinum]